MRKLFLFFAGCGLFCLAVPGLMFSGLAGTAAWAVEGRALPPSPSANRPVGRPVAPPPGMGSPPGMSFAAPQPAPSLTLPSGGADLNTIWLEQGSARLYQNTLVRPQQIRMGGASFVDPASVPQLLPLAPEVKAPVRRRTVSKASASKAASATSGKAPAGVSSTSLKAPAKRVGATGAMGAAARNGQTPGQTAGQASGQMQGQTPANQGGAAGTSAFSAPAQAIPPLSGDTAAASSLPPLPAAEPAARH